MHLIASHRGRSGSDPIFTLSKMASDRKAAGHDVVNGTLGALMDDDGKLCVLEAATQALREVSPEQVAAYAPIGGPPAFLAAVKREVCCGREDLLTRAVAVATVGGTGALRHAITCFVGEGEALLTTSYYWGPYATIASEHGRKVQTFSMFKGDSLDTEALDRELRSLLARQGRATLLLNDPCHNPTGYSMSDEDWRAVGRVIEACASLGPISVVLDSAYASFSEGSLERPVSALAGLSSRVLLAFCWSASKTFLLYGQRVGALVVVPPSAEDTADIEGALLYACRGTWSNGNHAGMLASTRLLADPPLRAEVDAQRARVRGLLDERVNRWNAAARPLGLAYPRYDGGFFVTVTSSDPARHAAALREQDCFVVPVAGALRVALCSVATRDVERLARAMAVALAT